MFEHKINMVIIACNGSSSCNNEYSSDDAEATKTTLEHEEVNSAVREEEHYERGKNNLKISFLVRDTTGEVDRPASLLP